MKHINIRIFGLVQGVNFRSSALKKAEELKIYGFCRNENNGSFYIEAEGEEASLNKFIDWCRVGPSFADIKKIESEYQDDFKNFKSFSIKY